MVLLMSLETFHTSYKAIGNGWIMTKRRNYAQNYSMDFFFQEKILSPHSKVYIAGGGNV